MHNPEHPEFRQSRCVPNDDCLDFEEWDIDLTRPDLLGPNCKDKVGAYIALIDEIDTRFDQRERVPQDDEMEDMNYWEQRDFVCRQHENFYEYEQKIPLQKAGTGKYKTWDGERGDEDYMEPDSS